MTSPADLVCPMCSTRLDLGHLIVAADDRAAFLSLLKFSLPISASLLRYVQLFAPPKTSLTQRKQARIIVQLLPDLQRGAITHRGRDWPLTLDAWQAGIDHMLQARDAGKLELPMKSHGYLYAILASLADKTEALAEAQTEAARKHPRTTGQGAANPAAMPDYMRQTLAALKNPPAKTP